MPKLTLLLPLAALAAAFCISSLSTAEADQLSCRSVNGNVTCAGPGAASCQTVDGRTSCVHGPDTRCETEDDRTICRSGGVVQSFGAQAPHGTDEDDDQTGDEDRPPSDRLSIERDAARRHLLLEQGDRRTLSIERDGGTLHLRNGALDLDIER